MKRVVVPEQHCTFITDRFVSMTAPTDRFVKRFTGLTEEVESWLITRGYHYTVEETPTGIRVDFLDAAAAMDFKVTWG